MMLIFLAEYLSGEPRPLEDQEDTEGLLFQKNIS
jgi:hypothetical protein